MLERIAILSKSSAARHIGCLSLLAFAAWALFFYSFDERAVWSSHEGRAGQHAQLVLDTGRWGMPTLYSGQTDYQKPPLYYWLVAATAWVRGGDVDAWSIRFPAAVAAALGLLLTYILGSTLYGSTGGVIASLILLSNLRYCWLARVGRIDMPLALSIAVCIACFWMAYRARSRRWLVGMYLSAALAMLLKGPVGLVLPAFSIAAFLAWEHRVGVRFGGIGRMARDFGLVWGVPLVLLVAGPWFVWATVESGGEFFTTFLLHHHWNRSLGAEGLKPEPFWYYVPRVFIDMFPWSLLVPGALLHALRNGRDPAETRLRFLAAWIISMFVFLSIVRFKRHDYLLPIVPGLALLLAGYWLRAVVAEWRVGRCVTWTMTGCLLALGSLVALIRNGGIDSSVLVSLSGGLDDADRLVAARLVAVLAGVPASGLVVLGAAFGAAACGIFAVKHRRAVFAAAGVSAGWAGAFLFYVTSVMPALEPLREQRTLAELARQVRSNDSPLYYYGTEDQQLMFYLGPQSAWLPNRDALRPVITRSEPVFVVMELKRYLSRRDDWRDVRMIGLARNTDNVYGTHRDPAVLVTNAAGWQWVRARGRSELFPTAN